MINEIKKFVFGVLIIDAVVSVLVGILCGLIAGAMTNGAGGQPTLGEMFVVGLYGFGKMFITGIEFSLAGGVCIALAYALGSLIFKKKS